MWRSQCRRASDRVRVWTDCSLTAESDHDLLHHGMGRTMTECRFTPNYQLSVSPALLSSPLLTSQAGTGPVTLTVTGCLMHCVHFKLIHTTGNLEMSMWSLKCELNYVYSGIRFLFTVSKTGNSNGQNLLSLRPDRDHPNEHKVCEAEVWNNEREVILWNAFRSLECNNKSTSLTQQIGTLIFCWPPEGCCLWSSLCFLSCF